MKTLSRGYTAEQMDRGEGMTFHPVDGNKFEPYQYNSHTRCWGYDADAWTGHTRPRIGDGNDKVAGDTYPAHWLFDPFTGEKLHELENQLQACLAFLSQHLTATSYQKVMDELRTSPSLMDLLH